MAMDRRTLVKYVIGASATGALAGCIEAQEADDGNGDADAGNGNGGGNGNGNGNGNGDADSDSSALEPEDGVSGEANLWHSLSEGEMAVFEGHVEDFNDRYEPTLNADEIAELDDRTMNAIPAGQGPELFMWAHDWVGEYTESGFLSDQSDELRVDLDTFGEAGEAGRYDGAVVGLPYAAETVGLIYNEEYVDEPPETFDELLEIVDEHHDPDGGTYGLAHNLDPYFYSAWAHAFGGYYFDEESGELGLTNDETIRGLELVVDELYPYMARDWEYDAQASVFLEGNAPLAVNGPWFLGDIDFDVGVAPFPEVEGNQPSPYTGIQLLYFTSELDEDAERAAAARSFAEWYVTNTDIILQMAEEQGYIPVHETFTGEDADELPDAVQGFAEAVEQGVPMPTSPDMQAVWEPVEDEVVEALQGNKSVAEAMEDAESRIRDNWE